MPIEQTRGVVFNIQNYSIHDGPGIRTTVFLMGCPLRCLWCQNPESQAGRPVLFFYEEKCTGCGACIASCPGEAIRITGAKSFTDRDRCNNCGLCVPQCPNSARDLMGADFTAAAVFQEVEKDALFYRSSSGGVTISGGEPLAQPDFTYSLASLCRSAGIHVAIETCGYAPWETVQHIMSVVDLVLYDFKQMDAAAHKAFTGVTNRPILENARRIYHELRKPMLARLPVVPGCNSSLQNVRAAAAFIATELGPDVTVHLLPYHRLGRSKHLRLESRQPIADIDPPSEAQMQDLLAAVQAFGLEARIGG